MDHGKQIEYQLLRHRFVDLGGVSAEESCDDILPVMTSLLTRGYLRPHETTNLYARTGQGEHYFYRVLRPIARRRGIGVVTCSDR